MGRENISGTALLPTTAAETLLDYLSPADQVDLLCTELTRDSTSWIYYLHLLIKKTPDGKHISDDDVFRIMEWLWKEETSPASPFPHMLDLLRSDKISERAKRVISNALNVVHAGGGTGRTTATSDAILVDLLELNDPQKPYSLRDKKLSVRVALAAKMTAKSEKEVLTLFQNHHTTRDHNDEMKVKRLLEKLEGASEYDRPIIFMSLKSFAARCPDNMVEKVITALCDQLSDYSLESPLSSDVMRHFLQDQPDSDEIDASNYHGAYQALASYAARCTQSQIRYVICQLIDFLLKYDDDAVKVNYVREALDSYTAHCPEQLIDSTITDLIRLTRAYRLAGISGLVSFAPHCPKNRIDEVIGVLFCHIDRNPHMRGLNIPVLQALSACAAHCSPEIRNRSISVFLDALRRGDYYNEVFSCNALRSFAAYCPKDRIDEVINALFESADRPDPFENACKALDTYLEHYPEKITERMIGYCHRRIQQGDAESVLAIFNYYAQRYLEDPQHIASRHSELKTLAQSAFSRTTQTAWFYRFPVFFLLVDAEKQTQLSHALSAFPIIPYFSTASVLTAHDKKEKSVRINDALLILNFLLLQLSACAEGTREYEALKQKIKESFDGIVKIACKERPTTGFFALTDGYSEATTSAKALVTKINQSPWVQYALQAALNIPREERQSFFGGASIFRYMRGICESASLPPPSLQAATEHTMSVVPSVPFQAL